MLLRSIEKHLRAHGLSPARFGRDAMGDPRFVFELRGGREPRPRTVAKVLAYLQRQA